MDSRQDLQRGASAVEFALVSGLILVVIFSLIEGSRYIATLGLLYNAADRAIAVASSDYRLTEPVGSPQYNAGMAAVQRKFRDSLEGTWIGIGPSSGFSAYTDTELTGIIPKIPKQGDSDSSEGESNQDALLNRPVKLTFSASMIPLIPCVGALFNMKSGADCYAPIRLDIFAASFKEPYKALTLPSPIDCRGRLPSNPAYDTDCACDVDKYWDSASGSCVCYSGMSDVSGCKCPGNWSFNSSDKRCTTCNLPPSACTGAGSSLNLSTCGCECNAAAGVTVDSSGGCTKCISTYQTYANEKCSCPTGQKEACETDPTKVYVDATCSCECKSGLTSDGLGSCTKCTDTTRKFENGNCNSCILTNAECATQSAGTLNTTTCACQCEGNFARSCTEAGGTPDMNSCTCNCGANSDFWYSTYSGWGFCNCTLPSMKRVRSGPLINTCQCNPDNNMVSDGGNGCVCRDQGTMTNYGSWCGCNSNTSCPPVGGLPQYFDWNTCSCGC